MELYHLERVSLSCHEPAAQVIVISGIYHGKLPNPEGAVCIYFKSGFLII